MAIATLAFLAGAGGLGAQIYSQLDFKTNIVLAGCLCIAMAIGFDLLLQLTQRLLTPWEQRGFTAGVRPRRTMPWRRRHDGALGFLGAFGGAVEFIFSPQTTRFTGGRGVGGLDQVWDLTATHLEVSGVALGIALILALPLGVVLGHVGRGEVLAISVGNSVRGVPELALIAFVAAFIGFGFLNVAIA